MTKKIKFSFILRLIFVGIILSCITALVVMKIIFSFSTITMPDLTGIKLDNAKKVAQKLNLILKVEDEVYNNVYEKGCIISQSIKPKMKIKKGRVIYVLVSKGSKMVKVPDITGIPKSKAIIKLKNSDLDIGLESVIHSSIYKENIIVSQFPPAGEMVPYKYKINILKSAGKSVLDFFMPDFKGENIFDVYKILKKNNILITDLKIKIDNNNDSGTVIEQIPAAGYKINKNIPVEFIVSKKSNDTLLKERMIKIYYSLNSDVARLIKIDVFSLKGKETIFNKVVEPGQKIKLYAKVIGNAFVQILSGKKLVKEIEYKLNGN